MNIGTIFLQVEGTTAGSPWSFWVFLILILGGLIYLLVARPFKKNDVGNLRKQEQQSFSDEDVNVSHSENSNGNVVQNNKTVIYVNSGSNISGFAKCMIIYGIWVALNLICLFAKSDSSYGSTQLRDAFFWPLGRTDIFYYGNEEFVVYAIVLPAIVGLIYWVYKRNK